MHVLLRFDEVHVGDLIIVADEHYPVAKKEMFTEFFDIDQRKGQPQFLEAPRDGFG